METLVNQNDEIALALEAFIPYKLNRAAELVSRRFAVIYKDHDGLTRPEWRTLATLGQYGTLTATAIGAHSSMHKTKVSRAVQSLEERNWLKRTTDENDRRVEHLVLTLEGARNYKRLAELAYELEMRLKDTLGEQNFEALNRGLVAVERKLGTEIFL
ncbi:MAG: winged helix-turn-helix transcriptional regulator [Hyphomicrobiales bacterium]|nr:winged helix-turn-helix transcriptional regulator [Hyphomicrobiales bacterium]MCP4997827.1 winged helix-turn-helix transcriptional regulator [Hyphomicrobiales bacterium]